MIDIFKFLFVLTGIVTAIIYPVQFFVFGIIAWFLVKYMFIPPS